MDDSRERRRWFQISLTSLFVLTLVIAAYFAGLATGQRRAERAVQRARQEAEAQMKEAEAQMQMASLAEERARFAAEIARRRAGFDLAVESLRKVEPARAAAGK